MTALTGHPDPAAAAGAKRDLLLRLVRGGGNQPSSQREQETTNLPAISTDPDRRNDPFPLTEIQQAYWIGSSAGFDFGEVSIHAYVEVEGDDIDLARLERSWQRLVDRHDMLRAVVLPDGQQRILPTVPPYRLKVTDLRGHDQEQAARALADNREELSHQVVSAQEWPGFDLRAILIDGGRTRVCLSVDMLHVDGGSVMILLDEWMQLYDDDGAELPALELSFRDYVLGEIAQRDSEQYQRSVAYWQDRVRTLPPPPALPVKPVIRDPAFRHRFQHRSMTLPADVWQRLKERATRAGLTSSGVLLSAYADILACWSKDDALTVNVTRFNRLPMHPQVNRILGDFTSMVLVEMPAATGQPFAERAATVQRQLWEGLEHRTVSGIRVLRDLARLRPHADGPLMPVVFSMLDLTAQGFQPPLAALRTLGEVVYNISQTPQVWLDHQVWEQDGTIVLIWDSVEDLFPAGLLDDMFEAYVRFLRDLADDETAWQRRGRSEHVPPSQLARRAAVNATDAAIPDDTLVSLFLRQAAERPGSPAVITSGRILTYEQILRQARRLSRTLRSAGVTPGTLVAVVMDKGWEQVAAVLGIQLAGAAYLPVDPGLPSERRAYLLDHGEVRIAVTQPWLDESLDWPQGISPLCVADAVADDVDDEDGGNDDRLAPVLQPSDLSHVIYTSGSTGQPKGVMIEHRNVVNRITDVNRRLEIGPGDRVLALTALHHDLSVYDIFGVLAVGAAMVIPDVDRIRDPEHWAGLMATEEVTIWNSVPAFLRMLVEYLEARTERPELLPRFLRGVVLAGDWIPVTLPERLRRLAPGAQFIASGGPTETTIWDIWNPVQEIDPDWLSIPYGRPMDNTRYHVLNRLLEPCPVWVPGQLCIAGAGLARGYWRDDAKTRERFVTHPDTGERIYLSGDIGRYLPDGSIEFLGRDDSQVKIGGHRIELGEVEAALRQHPDVRDAIVVAAGEPRQLTHLIGYVVPENASAGTADPEEAGRAPGSIDSTEFKAEDLTGISVVDPVQRIDFKLNQWGIRRDTDREAVALAPVRPDGELPPGYARRRSVREFSSEAVPVESLGGLLASLAQLETGGLPKYRYPSGGGLYPVQAYVYVKPGRVQNLAAGVYYHDPREHRLVLMSAGAVLDSATQLPHNRQIFERAAFAIFLIGQLAAIEPLYGPLARDFCVLEAGYMGQLLMSVAPEHHVGLCPVGAMDFASMRPLFDLDDSHFLTHLLIGGPVADSAWDSSGSGHGAARGPSAGRHGERGLVDQLRDFVAEKLPGHMRPAEYVMLGQLPLTPNGKVDRRLLPAPAESGPARPPDVPPRNDTERALVSIALRVLPVDAIGIHQNFFDVGADSIQMVQILNEIRKTFGREVSITEIFRLPTISSLAASLAGEEAPASTLDRAAERAARQRDSRGGQRGRRGRPDSAEERGAGS